MLSVWKCTCVFEGVVTLITKWQVTNGVWLEFSRGVVSSIVEFCDSPSAGAIKSLVSSRLVGCAGISQMQCRGMYVHECVMCECLIAPCEIPFGVVIDVTVS